MANENESKDLKKLLEPFRKKMDEKLFEILLEQLNVSFDGEQYKDSRFDLNLRATIETNARHKDRRELLALLSNKMSNKKDVIQAFEMLNNTLPTDPNLDNESILDKDSIVNALYIAEEKRFFGNKVVVTKLFEQVALIKNVNEVKSENILKDHGVSPVSVNTKNPLSKPPALKAPLAINTPKSFNDLIAEKAKNDRSGVAQVTSKDDLAEENAQRDSKNKAYIQRLEAIKALEIKLEEKDKPVLAEIYKIAKTKKEFSEYDPVDYVQKEFKEQTGQELSKDKAQQIANKIVASFSKDIDDEVVAKINIEMAKTIINKSIQSEISDLVKKSSGRFTGNLKRKKFDKVFAERYSESKTKNSKSSLGSAGDSSVLKDHATQRGQTESHAQKETEKRNSAKGKTLKR